MYKIILEIYMTYVNLYLYKYFKTLEYVFIYTFHFTLFLFFTEHLILGKKLCTAELYNYNKYMK